MLKKLLIGDMTGNCTVSGTLACRGRHFQYNRAKRSDGKYSKLRHSGDISLRNSLAYVDLVDRKRDLDRFVWLHLFIHRVCLNSAVLNW